MQVGINQVAGKSKMAKLYTTVLLQIQIIVFLAANHLNIRST